MTKRPRTGAWKIAIFKERGGNHGKPMKKTKEEQSKRSGGTGGEHGIT